MTRTRTKRKIGLGVSAQRLIRLASGLAESGSHAEDRYWKHHLSAEISQLLAHNDDETLNKALDHLYSQNAGAYEALADHIEALTESPLPAETTENRCLLIAIPVLAWSRYHIPTASLGTQLLAQLHAALTKHILTPSVTHTLALADHLFSPDQLPQGYCATAGFAQLLGKSAQTGENYHIDPQTLAQTSYFLADTRYILAAVILPADDVPLFAWQTGHNNQKQALEGWARDISALFTTLLPGCANELILPEAFFSACRRADRHNRPYALRACIAFLCAQLETVPNNLRACIAPFYAEHLEEYRIGFSIQGNEQIIHGATWPLLGIENENSDIVADIEAVLHDCQVNDIISLNYRFPLEYCEDCGAPLYPSAEGEMMHAEMPGEQEDYAPQLLH